MTKNEKLALMENRYGRLSESPKDLKCPGVKRKLARQIRKMKSEA